MSVTLSLGMSLTEKDLELAFSFRKRRFSDQTKAIARELFLDGGDPAAIADKHKLNRSRIYAIKDQVLSAYLEAERFPKDWTVPTFRASPQLIKKFEKMAQEEFEKLHEKK